MHKENTHPSIQDNALEKKEAPEQLVITDWADDFFYRDSFAASVRDTPLQVEKRL